MQMQIKVVNNFVGLRLGTTGYLRTTLIRYRGPCPSCMHAEIPHMHAWLYSELHIRTAA